MTVFRVTNGHQIAIVVAPLIAVTLATLCVVLRFRARLLRREELQRDDWLCLAALILTWAFQATNMAAVFVGGAGLPLATVMEIDPEAVGTYFKIMFVDSALWFSTVIVVQISVVFFYIRVFWVYPHVKKTCQILNIMIGLFLVAGFFSLIFSCTPTGRSWKNPGSETCLPYRPYCVSVGIVHVFFDLALVALPIPTIWNLQRSQWAKRILWGLLFLGLVATVISFLGIACIVNLAGISPSDVTDYSWLSILLQTLELPIGIICCCVPTLKTDTNHSNVSSTYQSSENDRLKEGSARMETGRLHYELPGESDISLGHTKEDPAFRV